MCAFEQFLTDRRDWQAKLNAEEIAQVTAYFDLDGSVETSNNKQTTSIPLQKTEGEN